MNSDDAISTPQTAGNVSVNAPDVSMNDTSIELPDKLGDSPRHTSREPNEVDTHIENLKTEFRALWNEFSNFQLENASNNIQVDLDDINRAHISMTETITSRMDKMDAFDKELSSQLYKLKELIQNNIAKPSLVPGQSKRDQAIAGELLFAHQMESRQYIYNPPYHVSNDKGKAPERTYLLPLPPSPPHQPLTSMSKVDLIVPITISPCTPSKAQSQTPDY